MLRDLIPARARAVIYTVLGFVFAAEGVLDTFGAGLLPARVQGIALGIAGAAGFSLARANVPQAE